MPPFPNDPYWWIKAAEAPLVAIFLWLLYSVRRGLSEREAVAEPREADALARTRDELTAFKLEVARTYVPLSLIRDMDARLTQQMLRIEEKLDEVARVSAATQAVVQHPGKRS